MSELDAFLQDFDGQILTKAYIVSQIGEQGFKYLHFNGHILNYDKESYLVIYAPGESDN
jgi:hypothetical protein